MPVLNSRTTTLRQLLMHTKCSVYVHPICLIALASIAFLVTCQDIGMLTQGNARTAIKMPILIRAKNHV